MDCEKIGGLIRRLRLERGLTQRALGEELQVSDKTISKWERGKGIPDVSLLPALAELLGVRMEWLLTGMEEERLSQGGSMRNLKCYVCPRCGNLLTAAQETSVACCGRVLAPLEPQKAGEDHHVSVELIENDYFVSSRHPMTKEHHLTFFALLTGDTLFLRRQYAEWDAQTRIPRIGHGKLLWYCTEHGLFYKLV